MILEHLPVLQIVIPLMSAPVCVLIRRGRAALAYAIAVTWLVFAMAVTLLARVLTSGTIVYKLGNWASPWGIEYRVDVLGAFVILFVSAIGAIVLTWSPRSLSAEIPKDRLYIFCAVYLLCLTGLLGITVTGDLFNLFVFLEITSLSSYALISLGTDRKALAASFRYLVMGTAGATFYLIGVGLIYLQTGTLNMMDMARLLPSVEGIRTVHVAFAFITVGLALKMALFPLHLWLPNAYAYAPSSVTAFLAATATKVSVYTFLRVVFTVFGQAFAFGTLHLNAVLMPVALAGILVASTVAIFQRNIKRMLAYSSVAQIGYMVLGLSFAAMTGLTASIVHLFNHALMKGGMFLAMGCIMLRAGSVEIDDLRGIGRRMPVTMAAWVVGGLGLIGVPLTVGFVSKWYLVRAALESDLWPVAALVLLSSLLALAYVWRVVEVAYFQPPPEGSPRIPEAPLSMLVPMWILIGATVVFGVWTPVSLGVARKAAAVLLGGAP